MKILMVCAADSTAPGEKQAIWLGEALVSLGHEVLISLTPDRVEGGDRLGHGALQVHRHTFSRGSVRASDRERIGAFAPDLIHARTTRAAAAVAAEAYREDTGAPLFVHWLDDEWSPLAGVPANSRYEALKFLIRRRVLARRDPVQWNMSTPRTLAWAAREAVAFDAITPQLAEEVRAQTGRACETILPVSSPQAWERGGEPYELPAEVGDRMPLLYTGDVNFGRVSDVLMALRAVALTQAAGHEVGFVHAGRNTAGLNLQAEADRARMSPGSVIELGNLPYERVPPLLRAGKILLQPGHPTKFNRLGLPSKLQSYLASGTPTITFAFGCGALLRDREEVLKTYSPAPEELATRIAELLSDEPLYDRLADGGPRAARRLFDPEGNARRTVAHYQRWI